jgi:predicted phage terminase large subunit-like protein
MLTHPGEGVIVASHTQDFAEQKLSREIRDAVIAAGARLRKDSNRLSHWELTNGASLTVAGVGSAGLTGRGASLLWADDLFPSREAAESPAERDRVFSWLMGTALTRLTPSGSAVLTGARWHLDDVHGRLAERGGWEVVNVPAIDEHGRALWPAGGWTVEKLEAVRRQLGAYEFSAQYQGTPIPHGGSLFVEPQTFTASELHEFHSEGARTVLALDPAAGQSHRNDWSAVAIMSLLGSGAHTHGLLLHVWRGRLAMPDLVKRVVGLAREWGASLAVVEGQGGFRGYADAIRSLAGPQLKVHVPVLKGDKWVRAQPLAGALADGRVRIPDTRPSWVSWWLDELLSFPSGAHDDACDATSLAFNVAALGPPTRSRAELDRIRARLAIAFGL